MSKSNRQTNLPALDALAVRWAIPNASVPKDVSGSPKTDRHPVRYSNSDDHRKKILDTYIQNASEIRNKITFTLFGVSLTVKKNVFLLLCRLIEAHGETVERQALADCLHYKSGSNVTGVVLKLRRALIGHLGLTQEKSEEVVPVVTGTGYRINLTVLEQFARRRG